MDFHVQLSTLKTEVEERIASFLDAKKDSPILRGLYEDIRSQVLKGGKRLRPILMIQTYAGFKEKDQSILTACLSCEFVHSASLILDDAMDEDILRHGKKTFNAIYADKIFDSMDFSFQKYGRGSSWIQKEGLFDLLYMQRALSRYSYAMSSLASNLLYSLSEKCLSEAGFDKQVTLRALVLHNEMFRQLNEGQLLDMFMEKRQCIEQDYLTMIDKKSGLLFAFPMRIAAILAGSDTPALDSYSFPMARGFQIHDDILGTFGGEKTGKPSDSDIKKGKRTLLVIKALREATEEQREIMDVALGKADATEEEVDSVRTILRDTKALEYCQEKARSFTEQAKKALDTIPLKAEQKAFLQNLADFVVEREF
ncbi:MAG: polyprenyl synthetase family protein [Theionarchaea archaeon]|nr:polyprenyl synthetase family protein [Theionarchaea archaeon]MBU7019838.1 polyprenyl synthetase family protein [Theionarchaea archaeon]MBU7035123.1 polyprenyl synthetase family protein [Theionarchaea archaeon]MBU7041866.1 polyprenyl synthetase family protein [Theionarchaea archaeon]